MPWVLAVLKWVLVTYFAYRPLRYMNILTAGILFAAVHAPFQNAHLLDAYSAYTWFDWLKRASLIVVWACFVFIDQLRSAKWPSVFLQWVLAANVLEAGIKATQDADFVCGVPICLLFVFSPHFFVDADGHVYLLRDSKVLGLPIQNPVSFRWYFRLYFVLIGAWHSCGILFHQRRSVVFTTLTCLIPLFWMECIDRDLARTGRICMIRLYAIIWATIMDTTAFSEYVNVTTAFDAMGFMRNALVRNLLQAAFIIVLLGACAVADKWKPLPCVAEVSSEPQSKNAIPEEAENKDQVVFDI
jgi:hypothetical protein